MRTDEWYDFQTNPRATTTVLMTIDESTYTGGTMGADHPLVWAHATTGGGRAIYTEMGHTQRATRTRCSASTSSARSAGPPECETLNAALPGRTVDVS